MVLFFYINKYQLDIDMVSKMYYNIEKEVFMNTTKNYHLRDIPTKVYEKIASNAVKNGRSVNKEIIMILTKEKEK